MKGEICAGREIFRTKIVNDFGDQNEVGEGGIGGISRIFRKKQLFSSEGEEKQL